MKKIFIIFILLFFVVVSPIFAQDFTDGSGGIEDTLQYTDTIDNAFLGQKKITDGEYQKALEQVRSKQKKGKQVKPFQGNNMKEENEGEYLNDTAGKNLLLSVPVELLSEAGTEIPIGHYKIVGEKIKDKVYLNFYQSFTLVARVSAIETNDDFGEMALNFVKLKPYNEQKIKILYGSIDFNAYTFIKIKTEISDIN